jgi:nanoRNase/pAp phosphatase (c-di-AMP/oligoRNAs hydrolase)
LNENFVFDIIQDINVVLKDFVVIDHHQGIELVNITQKYLVIKPKDFSDIEPSKYPASKMVFDLLGGKEWIASIGVIGDYSFDKWDSFLEATVKKISFETKTIFSKKYLFKLAEICSCIISIHANDIRELMEFLINVKNPVELFDSSFAEKNLEFQNLLKLEENRLEKDGLFFDDLDLVFFETKPRLPSKMSNIFSSKNYNKTFVVYVIKNNIVKCSFRRQDFKVNCNKLANFAVNGFEKASGGGHIPASAARLQKKDFEEFKQRIIDYLKKNYSK